MDEADRAAWSLASSIRFRRVEEEAVVVDQSSSTVMVINGVGARVLELIKEGRSEVEISAVVTDEYEVDAATSRIDLGTFLEALDRKGVIVRSEAGTG